MGKSKHWMKEHVTDPYVQLAKQEGYRARAVYKLLEINEKEKLFKPGQCIVDLGAAPGSWSEYAVQCVGPKGRVIALDILDMTPVSGADFIQGDFTQDAVLDQLIDKIGGRPVDLVISDMAPNLSGMKSIDQPRSMYLVELALDVAKQVLAPGGVFLAKVFQGSGVEVLAKDLRCYFNVIKHLKPKASRPRSRELYMLGKGFRGE